MLRIALVLMFSGWALAQTTPQKVLERLFNERPARLEWFVAGINQAQLDQVVGVVEDLKKEFGAFAGVRADGGQWVVRLERAEVQTRLSLDAQGRIAGVFFTNVTPLGVTPDSVLAEFKKLPGKVSVLVTEDGKDKLSLAPDEALLVGSAFKLAVLAMLKQQVEAGRRKWSDVVELRPEWKSLPSGQLQDWPGGAPLTLYTLAALMISQSDNTATDALMAVLGREAIEGLAGRNVPLLTTVELFKLYSPKNADLLGRYSQGNAQTRRTVLSEVDKRPAPALEDLDLSNVLPIGWYFTPRELCSLMDRVADLPLMGINPAMANPNDWARIAFKGGSQPGVINLTTALVGKNGKRYCVVATWNNTEPVDEQGFANIYRGLIATLK
jgi:beta-lactamase class A